jgi:hypothetical protein
MEDGLIVGIAKGKYKYGGINAEVVGIWQIYDNLEENASTYPIQFTNEPLSL